MKAIIWYFVLLLAALLSISLFSPGEVDSYGGHMYGRTDSVGHSAPDTLTRLDTNTTTKYDYLSDIGTSTWFSMPAPDSTLQYSTNPLFPLGSTWDIPAGSPFTSPVLTGISNVYIRKKSTAAGNSNYTISVWTYK